MQALKFLYSPFGRASRKAMILVTLAFVLIGLCRGQVMTQGATSLAVGLLIIQLALLWPAQIALPIRRFHDMGRGGFWVALFWGGGIIGAAFFVWGLSQTGALANMGVGEIWSDPERYNAAFAQLNAGRPPGEQIDPINASAMGGFSLAMIFLLIQFGWLHLIPGQQAANRFGASPLADNNNAIGD